MKIWDSDFNHCIVYNIASDGRQRFDASVAHLYNRYGLAGKEWNFWYCDWRAQIYVNDKDVYTLLLLL